MGSKKLLTYGKLMSEQRVLSYCVVANPPIYETTKDYQELMVNLIVNEDESYKRLIVSLLESEYHFETEKANEEVISEVVRVKLDEIIGVELNDLKLNELYKIAKSLRIKNFMKLKKRELIKKIESVREYFRNKEKNEVLQKMS